MAGVIDPQQAQKDFEQEQERRKAAKSSLQTVRKESAAGVTRLEEAHARARKGMGQRSAQAMAATLGQVGAAPSGGGQVAALRQAAATRSVSEASMGTSQAAALSQARTAAAEKAFETLSAEEALGTLTSERQQKITTFEQNLTNLMGQYLDGTLGIGNDVSSFQEAANALMATENDPEVRAMMGQRISQVVASKDGFNLLNFLLYPIAGQSSGDTGERL